jgi:hypothetical protein
MIPQLSTLQKMAHASYHHPPREGESEIDGWTLIQGNEWIKFYAKGNEVVIATRGSQTTEDWTDANRRIPFNDLESSIVYKRNEDYIRQFKANNPQYTTYYGVGHSLSGAINDIYLRKGIISEAVSYNPAVETQYFRKEVPNHRRIYMKDDPLYKLMGQWLLQKPEVRPSKVSTATWVARFTPIGNVLTADQYLKAHDIKQFEGGAIHRKNFLKKYKLEDKGYSITELAKISGVSKKILQEVYNRGIGAYTTNPQSVRMKDSFKKGVNAPMNQKLSKEQWAMARVYSFLDGNKKHDEDLRGGSKTCHKCGLHKY